MAKFTTTHEINCEQDKFWGIFFDKSTLEKLYLEVLGYPEFRILEQSETDQTIIRKVSIKPKMNMPGPITKLLGQGYRYTEEGTFDKTAKIFRWKWTPSTLADKLRLEGTIRIEPIGDNKVRQINEVTIEAKVFGVGGLLESSFEKQIREENNEKEENFNKLIAAGLFG